MFDDQTLPIIPPISKDETGKHLHVEMGLNEQQWKQEALSNQKESSNLHKEYKNYIK